MPEAIRPLPPKPEPRPHVVSATVNVRAIKVMADIGILPHEIGTQQPLIIDVELRVRPLISDRLEDGLDYRCIVAAATAIAATRTRLVETFALRLATACLDHDVVEEARVEVAKPNALDNGLASASVTVRRGSTLHAVG